MIVLLLLLSKMAKELEVCCNFAERQLVCKLPGGMMDVLLKIRTKSGEHTFWEAVYTRLQKYRILD